MLYRNIRRLSSFTTTVLLSFVPKRNNIHTNTNFFCYSFNIFRQQDHQQKDSHFGTRFITTTILQQKQPQQQQQQPQQPSSSKIRVGERMMSTTTTTTITGDNNINFIPNENIDSNGTSTSVKKKKIAIGQLCSTSNKLINLINIAKCAAWATQQNDDDDDDNKCCILFLPECFGFIGSNATDTINNAETINIIPIDCNNNQQNTNSDNEQQPLQEEVTNDSSTNKILESTIEKYSIDNNDDNNDRNDNNDKNDNNEIALDLFEKKISLVAGLQLIAKKCNIWISAGGMHVSGAPPNVVVSDTSTNVNNNEQTQQVQQEQQRVYNTHLILDNNGIIQCMYRKIHLFDVSIPGKVTLRESTTTAPGTELVICNSPIGCLGVTVCYDLRFPETYIALLQMGAQIMLVPSAFTVPTGTAHWHTLLRARAIENQCYVIAAAQYGKHNEKRESYGHSIVIDPWGTIIVDAGGVDGPGTTGCTATTTTTSQHQQVKDNNNVVAPHPPSIVTCTIDLNHLQSIRERMPIQIHRENAKGVLN